MADDDFQRWLERSRFTPRTPEEAHAAAIERGADCLHCPLYGCGRGPVMGTIHPGSRLAIVGEAPGRNEVERGTPFVGRSGQILDAALDRGGVQRVETTVTNVLLCQPPDDFESYMETLRYSHKRSAAGGDANLPTTCCAPRLARDLDEAASTVELAVGGQALRALAAYHDLHYGSSWRGNKAGDDVDIIHVAHMRRQHGAPIILSENPRKVLIASYHPAFAMRGARAWMPVIQSAITRAARIAGRDGVIDWPKPPYNIDPTVEDVEAFARLCLENDAEVTCDIETDSANVETCRLRCVGMLADVNGEEHVIVVPFIDMAGQPVWPNTDDLLRAARAVSSILNGCRLIFQNGGFDTSVLQRLKLMAPGRQIWFDTMLAHHNIEASELPHDLGFITSYFFEAPHHKDDADHKAVDRVGYQKLKRYNGDDLLTTKRAAEPLRERLTALGTWAQHDTDTQLAPVCRDMGRLGLVIDEHRRTALQETLTERVEYFVAKFQFEAALLTRGDEAEPIRASMPADDAVRYMRSVAQEHGTVINPNSVPKLRDWLFEKHALTPILNTDGFDYDEEAGDDPATSTAALLKLQDKYPHMVPSLDALLDVRAYSKLLGTYVADKRGRIRDVDWTRWNLPQCNWLRILNATYKIHVVPSGRLSVVPNIQAWPAVGKANMRTMVGAPPGHCIVGADYDQLELRIYAAVSRDKLLLQAFAENLDPHSLNAASLLARSDSEVWDVYKRIVNSDPKDKKYWRMVAKRFAFLELYGGEEDKLFATMAASRNKATGKRDFPHLQMSEVQIWHERWHKLHPETRVWQRRCQDFAYEMGYIGVSTLDFRKRFFPGGIDKKNAPPNHTIQGFAASNANRALIALADAIPHRGWSPASGLFLQVHDYIAVYVPRERVWEAKHIMEECMQYTYEGMKFTCTAESSQYWSDQG